MHNDNFILKYFIQILYHVSIYVIIFNVKIPSLYKGLQLIGKVICVNFYEK